MKKIICFIVLLVIVLKVFGQSNSDKSIKKKIDDLFKSYHHYNRFIGSVLISRNDTIVYQNSFGYANLKDENKNSKHSIFSIASLSKPLTAVGIMKLVEQEELTLKTPISKFIPDFMPKHSGSITIQHLLNHSSGIEANIGRKDESGNEFVPGEYPITFQEIIEKFKDSRLKFKPGTNYEYNNLGYSLLAQIIEKVSGLSYASFMEETIFNPIGMNNTSSGSFKSLNKRTYPYIGLGKDSLIKFGTSIHPTWIKGSGDINSTNEDLYKFLNALENGVLLKPSNVKDLYSKAIFMNVNNRAYGLGWVIDQKAQEKWIYHDGLLSGYASIMGILPERNIKIIILSNATASNLFEDFQGKNQFVDNEIVNKVISIIQGRKIELLPLPKKEKSFFHLENPKHFRLDNKHSLTLKNDSGTYWLETNGKEAWSVFTYTFSQDAKENNKACEVALNFAESMKHQRLENLVDYAAEDMKEFLGSETGLAQLKGMWTNILEEAGSYKSYNIYNIVGDVVKNIYIRFHFKKFDVGFVISINEDLKIQGLFMDDTMRTSHITKVKLVPIGNNEFFINGFKYGGFQDIKIQLSADELTLIDEAKTFKAKLVKH